MYSDHVVDVPLGSALWHIWCQINGEIKSLIRCRGFQSVLCTLQWPHTSISLCLIYCLGTTEYGEEIAGFVDLSTNDVATTLTRAWIDLTGAEDRFVVNAEVERGPAKLNCGGGVWKYNDNRQFTKSKKLLCALGSYFTNHTTNTQMGTENAITKLKTQKYTKKIYNVFIC